MAFELLGAIFLFTAIGWGLDYALKSGHRWTLVGAIVGIVAGGYQFIRKAIALNKRELEKYRREHASRQPTESAAAPRRAAEFDRFLDDADEAELPPDFDKY